MGPRGWAKGRVRGGAKYHIKIVIILYQDYVLKSIVLVLVMKTLLSYLIARVLEYSRLSL